MDITFDTPANWCAEELEADRGWRFDFDAGARRDLVAAPPGMTAG
jgi:hypothetical protein